MYSKREVFPDTPLALVAAEVRFTDSARLRQQATLDAITIALEERFPIAQRVRQQLLAQLVVGPEATPSPAPAPFTDIVVLTNAAKTESISITASSLAYETTHYNEFADLRTAVERGSAALVEAGVRPAIQRVGLRYIDEVRVPEPIIDARQWSAWIDHKLLDHLGIGPEDRPVTMTQGLTTFDLGERKGLNVRFAALNQDPVVAPQFLTRRQPPKNGPFFVLDFDGYEEFPSESAVTIDPEVVGKSLSAVHAPAGTAFQNSITDKARELFRGNRA